MSSSSSVLAFAGVVAAAVVAVPPLPLSILVRSLIDFTNSANAGGEVGAYPSQSCPSTYGERARELLYILRDRGEVDIPSWRLGAWDLISVSFQQEDIQEDPKQ